MNARPQGASQSVLIVGASVSIQLVTVLEGGSLYSVETGSNNCFTSVSANLSDILRENLLSLASGHQWRAAWVDVEKWVVPSGLN